MQHPGRMMAYPVFCGQRQLAFMEDGHDYYLGKSWLKKVSKAAKGVGKTVKKGARRFGKPALIAAAGIATGGAVALALTAANKLAESRKAAKDAAKQEKKAMEAEAAMIREEEEIAAKEAAAAAGGSPVIPASGGFLLAPRGGGGASALVPVLLLGTAAVLLLRR